jgi:MFS family permease
VAYYALLVSGACCLLSPTFFSLSPWLFVTALIAWGFSVVADSPQFSTLVAQAAPSHNKGTALTIVTSVGFAITIVSIQLLKTIFNDHTRYACMLLFIGPAFGLLSLKKFKTK